MESVEIAFDRDVNDIRVEYPFALQAEDFAVSRPCFKVASPNMVRTPRDRHFLELPFIQNASLLIKLEFHQSAYDSRLFQTAARLIYGKAASAA